MSGDTAMGTTTLLTTPCQCTTLAAPMAAPMSPPMRAWVEDDGRPNHQVIRFHVMAPIKAANTMTSPWVPDGVAMMPAPTVAATLVDTSAPTTFIAAAMSSATRGRKAFVVMETATALAASWKPLVKSKPRATRMMSTNPAVATGGGH